MHRIILIYISFCLLVLNHANGQTIPNNDFENWNIVSGKEMPDNWFDYTGIDTTILKSTDKYSGNYSLKLLVKSLGPSSCSNANIGSGADMFNPGFSISSAPGKLTGYYKFFPFGNDTAILDVSIVDNNIQLMGYSEFLFISTTSNFTYFEVPITYSNPSLTPGLALINITASNTQGNLCPYANSYVLIDQLGFSGSAGIFNLPEQNITINYNSNDNTLIIRSDKPLKNTSLSIYDMLGRNVEHHLLSDLNNTFLLSSFPKGVYFLKVQSESRIYTEKIILQ